MRSKYLLYIILGLTLGFGLLIVLISYVGLSAISSPDPLPELLTVIEMPNEQSTTQIAVMQNGYAYALNETSESIAVLDGPNLVATIRPSDDEYSSVMRDIVAHPENGLVYVADVLQGIHVISGTEMITTITEIETERKFSLLMVHPNSGYVYAGGISRPDAETQQAFGNIRVISGTQVLADIVEGGGINSLTPDPRNNRVYAGRSLLNWRPGTSLVSVIDGLSFVMTTTLDYDLTTLDSDIAINDIIVDSDSGDFYLLEDESNILYWDGQHVKRLQLRLEYGPLNAIGLDPKRSIVYAGVQSSPYALAIRKNRSPQQLRIVAGSQAIVYDDTRDYIYTADYNGPSMSVIRGTKVLATLSTGGRGPRDIGIDKERGYIYVSNADSHSIAVFGYPETEESSLWDLFLPFIGE